MVFARIPGRRGPSSVAIDSCYLLFSGPGQRRHQRMVGPFYDLVQAAAFEIEAGHGRAVLQRIVDLRRHRVVRSGSA